MSVFTSLHGRMLGISQPTGNLVGGASQVDITPICADATITVGDESANARAITIQLKDANGNDIATAEPIWAFLTTTAARTAFVTTGGSTGIAIGTDGALLAVIAKMLFLLTSEADGDIDLTWTDTGTEAAFLNLILPNGRVITSAALTNAG